MFPRKQLENQQNEPMPTFQPKYDAAHIKLKQDEAKKEY